MSAGPAVGLPPSAAALPNLAAAVKRPDDDEVAAFSLPLFVDPNATPVPRRRLTLSGAGADLGLLDTTDFTEGDEDDDQGERELGTENEGQTGGHARRETDPRPSRGRESTTTVDSSASPATPPRERNPAAHAPAPTTSRFMAVPISGPATMLNPLPSPPRVRARSAVLPAAEATAKSPTPKRSFQWREEVRDKLERLKRSPDGARIEVDLPEVGTVRLHLYKRPEGRQLRIHVASREQADVLRAHKGRLRAFLGFDGQGPLDIEIISDDAASRIGSLSPVDQPPRRHGT